VPIRRLAQLRFLPRIAMRHYRLMRGSHDQRRSLVSALRIIRAYIKAVVAGPVRVKL
jgi:hypothetical protein